MAAIYKIRLMFEWGGGCLWCDNPAAYERFDVGPIEEMLSLSAETRNQLEKLSAWHDGSLNWEYPPDPGPWSEQEYQDFDKAAKDIVKKIRMELGSEFEIEYVPLEPR